MERPRWVSIVAIFGIVLACLGLYGTSELLIFPKLMEFQRKMDVNVQELFDKLEAKEDSISVKALPSRGFFSIQSKFFPCQFGSINGVLFSELSDFWYTGSIYLLPSGYT